LIGGVKKKWFVGVSKAVAGHRKLVTRRLKVDEDVKLKKCLIEKIYTPRTSTRQPFLVRRSFCGYVGGLGIRSHFLGRDA